MNVLRSSEINLVPFISVDNMMRLVSNIGIEKRLKELAVRIEQDFERWELFDKTPRIASHSSVGVIEGELQQLPESRKVTEPGEVMNRSKPGRTSALQTTLFDSAGFAIEDFSALAYVKSQLEQYPCFVSLDILADPKDLLGMLVCSREAAQ